MFTYKLVLEDGTPAGPTELHNRGANLARRRHGLDPPRVRVRHRLGRDARRRRSRDVDGAVG